MPQYINNTRGVGRFTADEHDAHPGTGRLMTQNPHFHTIPSWDEVESVAGFAPWIPRETLRQPLRSLSLFVRDHRMREVPRAEQSLEAHYESFVFSQRVCGAERARELALATSYGASPTPVLVNSQEGRRYELGPEPDPDDPDGRVPALVTWADGDRFFLVGSHEVESEQLMRVAESLYPS